MTSSDTRASQSSATSGRFVPGSRAYPEQTAPRLYERKVSMTMSRAQASRARTAFLKLASDPGLRVACGLHAGPREAEIFRKLYKIAARQIDRRDREMRLKEHKHNPAPAMTPGITKEDLPFEELEQ